ncbi:MAG: hypothetical protein V4471_04115 [Pseudomonadota bacterium]
MLKKCLGLLFLSIISISAFAEDDFTFNAEVQYHAACPSKDYAKCARENKEIFIKDMDENSTISDVKKAVFKHEKEAKKFSPPNQVITCESLFPEDSEYADICWNDDLEGALFTLHLKEG